MPTQSAQTQEQPLSEEQQSFLDQILTLKGSKFLFVTGSAGTGKSTLLKAVQQADHNTIILAPTGIAAIQARGQTIHSFFGLRPGSTQSRMRQEAKQILKSANRLIIDEISMVRSDLLQTVNNLMQRHLENKKPFGGIPVIVFGDLSQIEPVIKDDEYHLVEDYGSHFFFDADCVKDRAIKIIKLNTIYRQQGETEYIEALQSLRIGATDKLHIFNNNRAEVPDDDCIRITYTNKRSSTINDSKLAQIDSPVKVFTGQAYGDFPEFDFPVPRVLTLKVGARVMTKVNNYEPDNDYVNGDIGVVTDIQGNHIEVKLNRDDGEKIVRVAKYEWEKIAYIYEEGYGIRSDVVGTFTQYPLRLAWALTAHSTQGQTFFGKVHLELEMKSFAHGLLYVALSRATKLDNLTLGRRIFAQDNIIDSRVVDWCERNGI